MQLRAKNPSISTREIARRVGISNGAAHYCVTALVNEGYVKLKNFSNSQTKVKFLYKLTPRGVQKKAVLAFQFLDRKRVEYNNLKLEIERLESEIGVKDKDRLHNKEDTA